ncbi:flagellar biosynthesis-like protein (FlhF) [Maricaulaceae bacterium MS644]
MRLRTFSGASLSQVMSQVRRELGPDAVIVTTADAPGGGVEVRAAAERGAVTVSGETADANLKRRDAERLKGRGDAAEGLNRIARALVWHQVSERAAEAIMDAAVQMEDGEATATLARALDHRYGVHPAEIDHDRPLLIAGPPGAGKSSALAKLAARAVTSGGAPYIISADARAGAREQMAAYAHALGCQFESVAGPRELQTLLTRLPDGPVLIDSPGVNPFELDDLEELSDLAEASDAEILAVMEAGIAPGDGEDAASLFASIGAGRIIATKIDAARRLGALLSFGEAGLAYAHISASPYIGAGLAPATALRLARALLEDTGWEDEI